jgi:phage baseplate assembly protein W
MPAIETPHLRWPFRLTTGGDLPGQVDHAPLQYVAQDSLGDVQQSVQLLLATHPGDRPLAPTVGIQESVFLPQGVEPDVLAAQLMTFEDRAVVSVSVNEPDGTGRQTVLVHVALVGEDQSQ